MQENFRTPEWWDNRTITRKGNLKDLIFNDDYRDQFWANVDELLSQYSKYEVADIGCGYGRFAKHFDKYTGYDFSLEMIKLANKENPEKNFYRKACLEEIDKVDVVFEVNCLHSFGVSREEFQTYYSQFARKAVICIERNGVDIKWIYEQTDNEKNRKLS
jgi:SAM-dependent methyltransferase